MSTELLAGTEPLRGTESLRGGQLPAGRVLSATLVPFALEEVLPGRLLALHGRLDVTVAPDVRLALSAAAGAGDGDLELDLAGLQQVDATGLGVLVGGHRAAARAGRALVLLDVPPQLERLLLVTRLHRVIRTARSRRSA